MMIMLRVDYYGLGKINEVEIEKETPHFVVLTSNGHRRAKLNRGYYSYFHTRQEARAELIAYHKEQAEIYRNKYMYAQKKIEEIEANIRHWESQMPE